jgi:hypothetical protein
MTAKATNTLTLDQPATYQIRVPGQISGCWSDWVEGMTITVDVKHGGRPVTTLTGTVDQAALHGLLRRLYSLGLPLISVNWVDCGPQPSTCVADASGKPGEPCPL